MYKIFNGMEKHVVRGVMAVAMAATLAVPMGVQASTKASTGWKNAALNSSTSTYLYYNGTKMGKMTVRSSGSQAITQYVPQERGDYTVYAGKSSSTYTYSYTVSTSKTVTYNCVGAAYGKTDLQVN